MQRKHFQEFQKNSSNFFEKPIGLEILQLVPGMNHILAHDDYGNSQKFIKPKTSEYPTTPPQKKQLQKCSTYTVTCRLKGKTKIVPWIMQVQSNNINPISGTLQLPTAHVCMQTSFEISCLMSSPSQC